MSAFLENPTPSPAAVSPSRQSFWRALLHRRVGAAAILFLLLLILVSVLAPLVAPYDPREQDLTRLMTGPSSHNLLGTDTFGRDILSRLIYGGRRSLLSIVEGVSVMLVLGVPLGLIAGYRGGWADRLLSRTAEIIMSIPVIILVLVVLAVRSHDENAAMVAFGVLGTPSILRVVRGATLKVREELYIAAARVSGLSHPRIVLRHVFPRVRGPLIVQATIYSAYALLFESGIAYLGLTGDPATPTWGGMIAEASTVIQQEQWLLFPPGTVIATTIFALGLLGNAVRDTAARDATAPPRRRRRRPAAGTVAAPPSPASSEALLSVRDLTVARDGGPAGETLIVDRVSFDVKPGEAVALVGESGCGKSVTALALLRLLPSSLYVTGGQVLWQSRDILTYGERAFGAVRGSGLGYVSQEPQTSLDPTFTVGSQMREVIRHHDGGSRASAQRRALELLGLVELPDPERVSRARAYELSGGMAQRVSIALALAGRPELLVADEPTTALDVTVQAEILGVLRRVQAETGMAMLMITHDWGVVADICDRTVVMYAGQIVEESDAQAMFDMPLHPYTQGLLLSHPSLAHVGEPLSAMRGGVPEPGAWSPACRFAARCAYAVDACREQPIDLRAIASERHSRCIRVEQIFEEAVISQ